MTTFCYILTVFLLSVLAWDVTRLYSLERQFYQRELIAPQVIDVTKAWTDHHWDDTMRSKQSWIRVVFAPDKNQREMSDVLVRYTLDGSDPRSDHATTTESVRSESSLRNQQSAISISISISSGKKKPLSLRSVFCRQSDLFMGWIRHCGINEGTITTLTRSLITAEQSIKGAGFLRAPLILSGTRTQGSHSVIRVWPKRMNDTIKCAIYSAHDTDDNHDDNDSDHQSAGKLASLWSESREGPIYEYQPTEHLPLTHIDLPIHAIGDVISVKCATSIHQSSDYIEQSSRVYSSIPSTTHFTTYSQHSTTHGKPIISPYTLHYSML